MGTRMAQGARANAVIRRESRGQRLSRARARARTLHLWIAAVDLMMACGVCALSFVPESRNKLFEKLKECVGGCRSGRVKDVTPVVQVCYCCSFTDPQDWTQDWVNGTGEKCSDGGDDINNWNVEKVKTFRFCEFHLKLK